MNTMAAELTEELMEDLNNFLKEKYGAAVAIWLELGVSQEAAKERLKKAVGHVQHLVEDLLEEETQMRQRVVDTIEECLREVRTLRKELRLPELVLEKDLTLLDKEEYLREQVEELGHLRVERLRRLRKLQSDEQALCKRLAMASHGPASLNEVPSEEDLAELLQHITMLEKESERRLAQLSGLRAQISDILQDLGEIPEPGPQRDLVCEDLEVLELSLTAVKAAKDYLAKLLNLSAERTAERQQLVERLSQYWERLDVPEERRRVFLSRHPGLKPSDFAALRQETARCEELKRERLAEFAESTKRELVEWYEKCGVPERRARLEGGTNNGCDESSLEKLETELQMMREFHGRYRALFEKVARRETLWQKLKVLEKRASDPGRFKNRGGGLLQEEKERKRLQKEFPKLEMEIYDYMETEVKGGDPLFAMWSENFDAHVQAQRDEYQAEKENEKVERQRKQQATPSSVRGVKRAGSATPLKTNPKQSRLGNATPGTTILLRNSPKLSVPTSALKRSALRRSKGKGLKGKSSSSTRQTSSTSKQPVPPTPDASTSAAAHPSSIVSVASYNEFTAALAQPRALVPVNSTFTRDQNCAAMPQQHEEGSH